jgi:hypothetical protein
MRLKITTRMARNITTPIVRLRSCWKMPASSSRPRPGHAKMVSVTTAPPSSNTKSMAQMVARGIRAFRRPCSRITVRRGSPLARPVRM